MKTKSTKEAPKKLAESKERLVNDAAKLHASFEPGDVTHQGDLIIVSIGVLPASAKPRANRQLADGDTQGSRHVLDRGDIFDADPEAVASLILKATDKAGCECAVDPQYIGPVFRSPVDPTADDLTHPEHGNQGFPAGTICAVVYQRNLDDEEREQRTRD
jgi:hypothetical protein